jgi:hypothetical protein
MDGINDWVFPTTRVADAVRFRPASLEAFYRLACDPWKEGGKSLAEVCVCRGKGVQDLLRELSALPVPGPESPWEELPVHFLIDYLTDEHRQKIHADLPAVRSILEMPFRETSGGPLFGVLLDAFHRFSEKLRAHIGEEEDILFPGILRNEHILRHACSGGRPGLVSDRLLVASRLLGREDDLSFSLREWTQVAGQEGTLRSRPEVAEAAAQAMQRLERKIRSHGDLERDRLYPVASRIESELAGSPVA